MQPTFLDGTKMTQFKCIQVEKIDDVSVVKIIDERVMDPTRIELLGKELLSLSDGESTPVVVINFSSVTFFSSAANNKLIVLERRVKARGGKLMLTDLGSEIKDLLGFTHLDSLFRIHNDQATAMKELAGQN